LHQYQKEHKNEPLPPDLRKIAQQKQLMLHPRKIYKSSLLGRLLGDRTGEYGDCPHDNSVCNILLYWCYNNTQFTEHVLEWCFTNLREEFKSQRNDFMPWLLLMERILQQKDKNFQKNGQTWIGKMTQLLNSCASSTSTGTDLLTLQLMSWFQRLGVRVPEVLEQVHKISLSETMEKYDKAHPEVIQYFGHGRGASRLSSMGNAFKSSRTKPATASPPSPKPTTGPQEE